MSDVEHDDAELEAGRLLFAGTVPLLQPPIP
jgi:hypothetical protein